MHECSGLVSLLSVIYWLAEFSINRKERSYRYGGQRRLPPSSVIRVSGLETLRGGANADATMETISKESTVDDPWIPLGGGAVNEKMRLHKRDIHPVGEEERTATAPASFDPTRFRSHLYHALEGLDRYPNYLSRWSEEDADRLEKSLEAQLAKVREQRALVDSRRRGIEKLVRELAENEDWKDIVQAPTSWDVLSEVLDPRFSTALFGSSMFKNHATRPTVEHVLSGQVDVEIDINQLTELMDEEFSDVYSIPLLSLDFCKRLREYATALSRIGQSEQYTQLHVGRYPLNLDAGGLEWLNNVLFHLVIRPISRHLFSSTESLGELDWRHGFIAGYSATPTEGKPRQKLVTHTDDSEVTLNLCLGDVFSGGNVCFRGLRGAPNAVDSGENNIMESFEPQPGVALLHAGRHFHDVTQVTSGDRFALIVWARSWQGVRSHTCACCWMNRRSDNSCICGPRWN